MAGGSVNLDLGDYMKSLKKSPAYPETPYSHAASLLDVSTKSIIEFQEILSKDIKLANIGGETKDGEILMRLYQLDIVLLTELFQMAKEDSNLWPYFYVKYYSWLGEIGITRAKGGLERHLQASAGGQYIPPQGFQGYGEQLEMQEKDSNPIRGLLGMKRKKPDQVRA
jgi:hypothetical protein